MILNTKTKLLASLLVFAFVLLLTLLEHVKGGVKAHHFFNSKDMPSVSNWWGLLSVPLMFWLCLSLMQKRKQALNALQRITKPELYGFVGSLLFGSLMTALFYSACDITNYVALLPFVLALFVPIYKPEFYLGFIVGMVYGFGGILPEVIGWVWFAIFAVEYCFIRKAVLFIWRRLMITKT